MTGEVAVDLRFGQLLLTGGSALRATRWAYRQGVAESRFCVAAENTAAKRATRAAGRWAHRVKFIQGNVLRSSVTLCNFPGGRGSGLSTPPERAMRDGGGGG